MTALRQGATRLALIFLGTALAALQAFSLTVSNGPIAPGVWNSGFSKARTYAEQHNLPLVVFWGSSGCGYCSKLKNACSTAEFADWQASCALVLCQIDGTNTADGQAAKSFVGSGSYPLIRIYWLRKDGTKADVRFVGRTGQMKNGGSGTLARQFINAIEAATAGFAPGGSAPDP